MLKNVVFHEIRGLLPYVIPLLIGLNEQIKSPKIHISKQFATAFVTVYKRTKTYISEGQLAGK